MTRLHYEYSLCARPLSHGEIPRNNTRGSIVKFNVHAVGNKQRGRTNVAMYGPFRVHEVNGLHY